MKTYPLLMSASKKVKKTRKTYSQDEKIEILAFVEKHDAEKGRGGKSAAVAQFGISPVSLSTWIKAGGTPVSPGKKRGRKPGSKNAPKNVQLVTAGGGNLSAKLKSLSDLAKQIDEAESELRELRGRFDSLKAAL